MKVENRGGARCATCRQIDLRFLSPPVPRLERVGGQRNKVDVGGPFMGNEYIIKGGAWMGA